jgi:hypothetical protein
MKISINPGLPVSLGGTGLPGTGLPGDSAASRAVIRAAIISEHRQFTSILESARLMILEAFKDDCFCLDGMNEYLAFHGLGEYAVSFGRDGAMESGDFTRPVRARRAPIDRVDSAPALAEYLRRQREDMDARVSGMARDACECQLDGDMSVPLRRLDLFLALLECPSYEAFLRDLPGRS